MQSKDFKILVERLQKENSLHREKMAEIYRLDIEERLRKQSKLSIHEEYVKYNNEMINFVKRLDKELHE